MVPLTVSPADPQPAFGFLPSHLRALLVERSQSPRSGGGELSHRGTTGEATEEEAGMATWPHCPIPPVNQQAKRSL